MAALADGHGVRMQAGNEVDHHARTCGEPLADRPPPFHREAGAREELRVRVGEPYLLVAEKLVRGILSRLAEQTLADVNAAARQLEVPRRAGQPARDHEVGLVEPHPRFAIGEGVLLLAQV